MKPDQERVLRPRPWFVATVALAAIVFVIGAVSAYRGFGWGWLSGSFVGLSLIGVAGLLEVSTTRIRLSPTTLEFGSLWSRHKHRAEEIESVTWAAGAGVSVKLAAGGWARLPEMGYNSQGLSNTLRAWLKRARKSPEAS